VTQYIAGSLTYASHYRARMKATKMRRKKKVKAAAMMMTRKKRTTTM
jgi:hypothetical protein